jgi:hypothetical protein
MMALGSVILVVAVSGGIGARDSINPSPGRNYPTAGHSPLEGGPATRAAFFRGTGYQPVILPKVLKGSTGW